MSAPFWSRRLLGGIGLLVALASAAHAATAVVSTRVWPATEYTRITLETQKQVSYKLQTLSHPDRLVLDLEQVDLGDALKALPAKVTSGDPYIQQVRVAQFKPGVVRVVVDLKSEIRPAIFTLSPAGEYQHRLVLDIFPKQDSLMTLLQEREPASESAPAPQEVLHPVPEAAPLAGDMGGGEEARLITIVIDAGHGGEDPGARGPAGTHEKNITLSIAQKLKVLVDAEPNMRGVLTREGDYFIPLRGRVNKARKLQADLFVSIHADAFTRPDARGSSVFALSERGATSAMARYLANKENESDLIGGVTLDGKDPYLVRTLLDLSQTATINDSLKLGRAMLTHLGEINTLHKSVVEQAGFAVLKSPDIPSVLVETAFISNPEEERKLNDEAYQEHMATAILSGIRRYFVANPPLFRARATLQ